MKARIEIPPPSGRTPLIPRLTVAQAVAKELSSLPETGLSNVLTVNLDVKMTQNEAKGLGLKNLGSGSV